jgi:hypothetical protein
MKKHLLIAIFSFLLFSCKKSIENKVEAKKSEVPKKYQTLVDSQIIYSLLNSDALTENKVFKNCENVLNRQTMFYIGYDSVLLKKVDTLFSVKDKEFISKQYRNGVRFILNQKFLKHKKVIEYDTTMMAEKKSRIYWNKMLEKYHCIGMINTPLFNLKKDMAILEIGYNCGTLCGEGGTYIYRLKNGKWELYLTIEKWVS